MTSILGISAFYHDSAACILIDGEIIAAAQEERFTRKKHDQSYPHNAVKFVLEYSNLPVVSTDIIGNKHSSIFDAPFTRVIDNNFVKTLNWYDNEWGYSNRVVDLMALLGKLL